MREKEERIKTLDAGDDCLKTRDKKFDHCVELCIIRMNQTLISLTINDMWICKGVEQKTKRSQIQRIALFYLAISVIVLC